MVLQRLVIKKKGVQELMVLNTVVDYTTRSLGAVTHSSIDPEYVKLGETVQIGFDLSELPSLQEAIEWFSDSKFDFKQELLKRSGIQEKVLTSSPVSEWPLSLIECYILTIVVFDKSDYDPSSEKLKTIKDINDEIMHGLKQAAAINDFLALRG